MMRKALRLILAAAFAVISSVSSWSARIDTLSLSSAFIPSPAEVTVIVPENIPADSLSTVFLLNGYGGNHLDWISHRTDLPALAEQYGMLLVMPDGRDSWYFDSPVDSTLQMESYITRELIPYIHGRYPVSQRPERHAVTGLSMGGHGAMYLAIRHPEIFRNAGTMSGGVDMEPFPENWKIAQRIGPQELYPQRWHDMSVVNMVENLQPEVLNITIDCGKDDFFADANHRLHEKLTARGVDHDYTVRPGAHTWAYWNNSILYHLLFFDQAFKKFIQAQ